MTNAASAPCSRCSCSPGSSSRPRLGLFASWVDRKLTARLQKRVGPPFLQPLYDVCKLMLKETCVPEGASLVPSSSAHPLLGLAGAALASVHRLARTAVAPGGLRR